MNSTLKSKISLNQTKTNLKRKISQKNMLKKKPVIKNLNRNLPKKPKRQKRKK